MESLSPNPVITPSYWRKLFYLLVALLFLFVLYFSYASYWQTSALKEILAIQVSKDSEAAKEWPKEKRNIAQDRMLYLEKNLNKESRKELTDRNSRAGFKKVEIEFDRILNLDQKNKNIELDIWIDREEKSKQDREKNIVALRKQGKAISLKKGGNPLSNQDLSNLLDVTTPELRAKFHQLVKEINQRRQGRSLPPWNPFSAE